MHTGCTDQCRHVEERKRFQPGGPWMDEPDRVEFRHAGFPCILHRGGGGAWCGYVGLPPGHAAHGKNYSDVDVDVHCGLTYGQSCGGAICHVPAPGEPDDLWWLGFDCSHLFDWRPVDGDEYGDPRGSYKTVGYAKRETERLAEQLSTCKP